MIEKDNEDLKNSTKCWICDKSYVKGDVKVKDHCHITGKYMGSAHKDFDVNVKLNHKIHIVLQNLKNCDSYLIMQELGKLNFEINVTPNGLEKHMSFNINNKLIFIDSFQFFLHYIL